MDLYHKESGKGENVLLFIHGLGSTHRVWDLNVISLQADNQCVVVDLPGYGQSSPIQGTATLEKFARVIEEFVRKKGFNNLILVGHSMGGQLALILALRKKIRIQGLVLLAPAGFETFSEAERKWFQLFYKSSLILNQTRAQINHNFYKNFFVPPPLAAEILQERLALTSNSAANGQYARVTAACVQSMLSTPVYNRLQEINLPILLFFGKNDNLIPNKILHSNLKTDEIAQAGHQRLRNSSLILLDNCGHFIQMEKAETVNRGIIDFLYNISKNQPNGEATFSDKIEKSQASFSRTRHKPEFFNWLRSIFKS